MWRYGARFVLDIANVVGARGSVEISRGAMGWKSGANRFLSLSVLLGTCSAGQSSRSSR